MTTRATTAYRLLLAAVLLGAFALRLVGIRHGLPFSYNQDEELHFVPEAAAAADGDLNPHYFENPAALTYLLAMVLRLAFLGDDVTQRLAEDPTTVLTVARVTVALLGVLLVALVAWAGRRYFGRTAGLVAAATMAVAFLPVFYSHQALNDVPTMLPVTVALVGWLRIWERGDLGSFLLAGAAVGVAAGTKYTAAPLALTVALAAALRLIRTRGRPAQVVVLLVASGAACVVGLVALKPLPRDPRGRRLAAVRPPVRPGGGLEARTGRQRLDVLPRLAPVGVRRGRARLRGGRRRRVGPLRAGRAGPGGPGRHFCCCSPWCSSSTSARRAGSSAAG